MAKESFMELIAKLEAEITAATGEDAQVMQDQLHQLVEQLRRDGKAVPQRLRDLDQQLIDDAVETQFDNMPV